LLENIAVVQKYCTAAALTLSSFFGRYCSRVKPDDHAVLLKVRIAALANNPQWVRLLGSTYTCEHLGTVFFPFPQQFVIFPSYPLWSWDLEA
jgi:hypothetical protein